MVGGFLVGGVGLVYRGGGDHGRGVESTAVALWLLHFTLLAAAVLAYGYMPPPFAWQRHFVVPTAIVIVLLVAVIGARRWAIAAGVWLAVGAGAMVHDFAPSLTRIGPI